MANTSCAWLPVHDNHAIDVMAISLRFGQPIPDLVLKRALKAGEDAAFQAGLRSRHTVTGFAIPAQIGGPGAAAPPLPVVPTGRIYNSLREMPTGDQPVPEAVIEQLQITNFDITYRTWSYVSWKWQSSRAKLLIADALKCIVGVVPVQAQRLEYLDRFRFDGPVDEVDVAAVLKDGGEWVAPHVFKRRGMWHSHTGAFLPNEKGTVQRLAQVHIDAFDDPTPTRWINVMTAREDREQNEEAEQSADTIFSDLDKLHEELIDLFGSLVTKEIADQIYLTGSKQ